MKFRTPLWPLAGFFCLLFSTCKQKPDPEPTYKLVWSDEFNTTGLPDSTRWSYETGSPRNKEAQNYVAKRLANSRVENGNLILTALNDNFQSKPISSASIHTKGKADFLYGKIEVRAKMPVGKGAWTAIWTKGVNFDQVNWPACGEIDIMEWLGFAPIYVFGSLHKANASGQDAPQISISPAIQDLSDNFHTYTLEWDETQILMSVDDLNYAIYKAADMTPAEWQQFTKPHYLLLNLAMGGVSGGEIDDSKFPFVYTIDYVRYYKKE
ncbi:glycoside hydrolase family 16 protein [Larkinella rosea]|uniref:Glycoside hydrolase family 16 protein n=1 Tax=Larkinella rosea TaxID=2025312 RepID=A0A3P1C1M1_9BACT|nr:glycoside hydrolase family 16 protein [Larkinella rosea]RRB07139.1 glycoside hydrolase family 16 protein [Larkinella rosea]